MKNTSASMSSNAFISEGLRKAHSLIKGTVKHLYDLKPLIAKGIFTTQFIH